MLYRETPMIVEGPTVDAPTINRDWVCLLVKALTPSATEQQNWYLTLPLNMLSGYSRGLSASVVFESGRVLHRRAWFPEI